MSYTSGRSRGMIGRPIRIMGEDFILCKVGGRHQEGYVLPIVLLPGRPLLARRLEVGCFAWHSSETCCKLGAGLGSPGGRLLLIYYSLQRVLACKLKATSSLVVLLAVDELRLRSP